jgi:CheY-like chemotaxis protein
MRVLLVDDDSLQTEWLQRELGRRLPTSQFEEINTENEFRTQLEEIEKHPPDIILLDVMLRWTDAAEVMPPMPTDVAEGKYYSAGFRCLKLLSEVDCLKDIPVILLTVLDESDLARDLNNLPANVVYIAKTADPEALYLKVLELTRRQH